MFLMKIFIKEEIIFNSQNGDIKSLKRIDNINTSDLVYKDITKEKYEEDNFYQTAFSIKLFCLFNC